MRSSFVPFVMVLTSGFASGCASQKADEDFLTQMLAGRAPKSQLSSTERAEVEKHPLGSEENPVLAQGPPGERAYLYRLRCPEGKPPIFERHGSAARMSPYGSIMDIYELACDAPPARTIYMDMYHPDHVEKEAVSGFTIVGSDGT